MLGMKHICFQRALGTHLELLHFHGCLSVFVFFWMHPIIFYFSIWGGAELESSTPACCRIWNYSSSYSSTSGIWEKNSIFLRKCLARYLQILQLLKKHPSEKHPDAICRFLPTRTQSFSKYIASRETAPKNVFC